MLEKRFRRFCPPGFDSYQALRKIWIVGFCIATLYVVAAGTKNALYSRYSIYNGEKFYASFTYCFNGLFWVYRFLAMIPLMVIVGNFVYLTRESRALWALRLLPGRWEIGKRTILLPVLTSISLVLSQYPVRLIIYLVYRLIAGDHYTTPALVEELIANWGY